MREKTDMPIEERGSGGRISNNTTSEPNNGNTIVKVIVCLFVVGIILTAIINIF